MPIQTQVERLVDQHLYLADRTVKLDLGNNNTKHKASSKNNFGYKKKPDWIRVKLPTRLKKPP